MKDGTPEGLADFMALGGCAVERHEVPNKAQDRRWAWAGVEHGAPEGPTGFMALSASAAGGAIARRYFIIVPWSDDGSRKALSLSVHAYTSGKARSCVGTAPGLTQTRQNPASLPVKKNTSQEIVEWQNPKFKTA